MKNSTIMMRNGLFTIGLLAIMACSAQTWNTMTLSNFLGTSRYACTSFTIGDVAYVGSGTNSTTSFKDFWSFSKINFTWIRVADMPVATSFAFSFSIGGKGYVGCGTGAGSTNFWEYDPALDKWTAKASLNTGSGTLEGASGFSIGTKGYVVGGQKSGVCTNELWQYDPSNDKWSLKSTSPINARMNASCFVLGNKAYYGLGGTNYTAQYKDFTCYDATTNTWGSVTSFPLIPRMGAMCVGIDDYGIVYSGQDNAGAVNVDTWKYDSKANTWSQLTNIPMNQAKDFGTAFVIQKKAYLTCGIRSLLGSSVINQTNTWDMVLCPITIKGTITYSGGGLDGNLSNAWAILYRYSVNSKMIKADSARVYSNGTYSFPQIANDNYVVYVGVNSSFFPYVVPTYSGDSVNWNNSKAVITVACNKVDTVDIKMVEVTPTVGKGIVKGSLLEGKGYKGGKMMTVGVPIAGIGIGLGKKPNPGANMIANTKTDSAGNYVFQNLPVGNYQLLVDIAGLPLDSTYTFSVTAKDTVFNNFDFLADSAKINKVNNFTGVQYLPESISTLSVYPNPFKENTSLSIDVTEDSFVDISVYNLLGEKISVIENQYLKVGERKYNIYFEGYGMFLLVTKVGDHVSTNRVFKMQ